MLVMLEDSWFNYSYSFAESVFAQLLLCLLVYIMLFLTNPFYVLFYFFIHTLVIGIFIATYNLEFFTGFLYVLEITVVFIMLILFFFFNFKGSWSFTLNEYVSFWPSCFLFIYSTPTIYTEEECLLPNLFRVWELWDDYYSALSQHLFNDFAGLYISYYLIHSLEFIIIGFILFLGSIGCIALYSILNLSKRVSYNLVINFLSLFTKFYDILFLRRQTLTTQTYRQDAIRSVSRINNKGLKDLDKVVAPGTSIGAEEPKVQDKFDFINKLTSAIESDKASKALINNVNESNIKHTRYTTGDNYSFGDKNNKLTLLDFMVHPLLHKYVPVTELKSFYRDKLVRKLEELERRKQKKKQAEEEKLDAVLDKPKNIDPVLPSNEESLIKPKKPNTYLHEYKANTDFKTNKDSV